MFSYISKWNYHLLQHCCTISMTNITVILKQWSKLTVNQFPKLEVVFFFLNIQVYHSLQMFLKTLITLSSDCLMCYVKWKSHNHVQLFATPGIYSRWYSPEYWSGQPLPSPRDLPKPGVEPRSPPLVEDSLPTELPGKSDVLWLGFNLTIKMC